MTTTITNAVSKVPAITLGFWIIKLLATTLGEVGGNAFSMSLELGYVISTGIFAVLFIIAVFVQVKAPKFHPFIYWFTIIITTILGTTTADLVTRDLGVGYTGGSLILLGGVLASLVIWRLTLGSISVETVATPKVEAFYWVTIMWSQTLGTALGDWFADTAGFGYLYSAVIFAIALVALYVIWRYTGFSRAVIFWAAFIITRPFGAVLGNFFDKPAASGGLGVNRFVACGVMLALIVLSLFIFPQRAAESANKHH